MVNCYHCFNTANVTMKTGTGKTKVCFHHALWFWYRLKARMIKFSNTKRTRWSVTTEECAIVKQ